MSSVKPAVLAVTDWKSAFHSRLGHDPSPFT